MSSIDLATPGGHVVLFMPIGCAWSRSLRLAVSNVGYGPGIVRRPISLGPSAAYSPLRGLSGSMPTSCSSPPAKQRRSHFPESAARAWAFRRLRGRNARDAGLRRVFRGDVRDGMGALGQAVPGWRVAFRRHDCALACGSTIQPLG